MFILEYIRMNAQIIEQIPIIEKIPIIEQVSNYWTNKIIEQTSLARQ